MDRKVYQIIEDYKKILEEMGVKVKKIILYGSYAIGPQDKYSDIDLVVISDDFKEMDLWERLTLLGRAMAKIGKPIEALGYTEKEFKSKEKKGFIRNEVKSKGIDIL